ncbi:MAG: hypothetical protein WD990_10650 [Acidimicrobiia bacterium]
MVTSSGLGPLSSDHLRRVNALRNRLTQLEDRYGADRGDDVVRLDQQIQRRTSRIDVLSDQLDQIVANLTQLESERIGLLAAADLVMRDRISEIQVANDERWSPWPIQAFRVWGVTNSGLVGMFERWQTPEMEAVCGKLPLNPDVPHTDGRCGEPQCGIYAAKRPEAVLESVPPDGGWALGLVSLSGKVVEHEHGFRAQRARVEAIVIHHDNRVLAAEEAQIVRLAFAATVPTTKLLGRPAEEWPIDRTLVTLKAAERRLQWTSEPFDA